ncbi:MAG: GNAT family N-acetyltransferase [Timaviella obliquedivisa GSE-PSE-MK23-08B]|jgi:putative N-acetyltransferase (TIGR04045 family)|nr:GNAT family N-acetyltransferase [Timaviella obliquedivisa GSE-PSE-MK23-08B]
MQSYSFNLATTPTDVQAYFALRHQIFVEEQGLFSGDSTSNSIANEVDDRDAIAYPIVAKLQAQVVGVVRIYELQHRIWYGGRLGVHVDHRRAGKVGKGLIHQAVTTAHGWGCDRFLATVQSQNVRFFQRLHWTSLEELHLCGLNHALMEADLSFYPPGSSDRPLLQFPNVQPSLRHPSLIEAS